MPNLRLRLRHGEIVEKLPGRCLFCGKRVVDFKLRVVPAGNTQYYVQLPLCDEDRKEGKLYVDDPRGGGGRAMEAVAARSPIVFIFWSLFKLFSWAGKPKQERNDQFVVIGGVCPEFLDAFDEMGERVEEAEEDASEQGAPTRSSRRSQSPSAVPWVLAAVGTLLVVFFCCGGVAVVGVMQRRAWQQEQNLADRSVNPPAKPVVMPPPANNGGVIPPPPANGGGVVPPPPPPPPIGQPAQNDGRTDSAGEILPTPEGLRGNFVALIYAPKGDALISAGEDGTVRWWRFVDGKPPEQTKQQAASDKLYGLTLSPNGEHVAATAWYGNVVLMDGKGTALPVTLETRTGKVSLGLAFSSDSKTLMTGHFGHVIKVWDVDGRKMRTTLKSGSDWTMAIAFSPDGKLFATAGGDNINLWDAPKQQSLGTLEGHKTRGSGSIRWLAFSPDSKTLASAADDGTARLWDLAEKRERFTLTHPEKQVTGAAFTPNGALLVTGCKDGQVRIWDTATGRQRGGSNLPVGAFNTPAIAAVAISPDGTFIATAGGRFLRRWKLAELLTNKE